MDWLGIGVLLIGSAFLILVIVLIKPLNKLSDVLTSVQQTTDTLPEKLSNITEQTTLILKTSNETIANVNKQVSEVSPVFHIIGDVGQASRELTTTALHKTLAFKQKTEGNKQFTQSKKYEGLYGLLSLVFILFKNKDRVSEELSKTKII